MEEKQFIKLAIQQANLSLDKGGFPAGAVLVKNDKVVCSTISIGNLLHDPTSHAETASIREACKILETSNLSGTILYASLQPCLMCFLGANWAGISKIVYACGKTNDMVKKRYYEGDNDISNINERNSHQIELVHLKEFEEESLNIVKAWERKVGIQ